MFVNFLNTYAQNPVQEFNFNGNLSNTDNTISFLGTPVYVNDRMGGAKGALRITNKAFQAVVGDLPQGNKPRTLSMWIKFNAVNTAHYVFSYGSPLSAQYFGVVQQPATNGNADLSLIGWETANNMITSVPLVKEVWYLYSVTYDGNISKIYRNGELLKSEDAIPRLTKGYILSLGKMNATTAINADVDDLKLYSVAMTGEQVKESYESSKPIVTAAAQKAQVLNTTKKPEATAKAIAQAKTTPAAVIPEENAGPKNVEIFSNGKKIMGANTVNIDDLPEGTYLMKITKASK